MVNDWMTVLWPMDFDIGRKHWIIYYGDPRWPSYSYWIVPGTIDHNED